MFLTKRLWVQSLVGELRFHVPHGAANKQNNKRKDLGREMSLKKGDLIECADDTETIRIIGNLSRANIKWDFCYEKDGVKGIWIEVM